VITALWLLVVQGFLGAFDTLYYHEYRARLPGGVPGTSPELVLHGVRDLFYSVIFGTLPFWRWNGLLAWLLAVIILVEIGITLRDFVIEDEVRRPLGGVYAGERSMHAIMGIIYGAALANLAPALWAGSQQPTAFEAWEAPLVLRCLLLPMAIGVLLSGIRDLGAVFGPRWMRFPWGRAD
jgi:hypothetical protein